MGIPVQDRRGQNVDGADARRPHRVEGGGDLVAIPGLEHDELDTESGRGLLELRARGHRRRVDERADPPRLGDELMQHLEPLHVELAGENADTGRIAAGARHAGGEPAAHHVVGHPDDRNGLGRPLRRLDRRIAELDDDVDGPADQLPHEHRDAIVLPVRKEGDELEGTPSSQPSTLMFRENVATKGSPLLGPLRTTPITGIRPVCAAAGPDKKAAAPAKSR